MGKVYLVGAGPGDPDLITLKGLKCIQNADVILYDRLVNQTLLDYAKPKANLIFCGKFPGNHVYQQDTINHLLVKHAKAGKVVTRLKGGDPFVFGRGGEEAQVLAKQGITFEIVPGITSGIAAAAYAGIPVTHRDYSSSVVFVTGHDSGDESSVKWESIAKGIDTIAVYMGIGNLPIICDKLVKYGRSKDTPVAVIHWGTLEGQKTVTGTIETICDIVQKNEIKNPSMTIIGDVVKLRDELNWFEKLNETELKTRVSI